MRLDALPEHLVIVGAGYVGAEFAHVFSALGSRVSIIGRSGRLLRAQDEAIAERFTELARRRWDVHLGQDVVGARGTRGDVTVELADGTSVRGDVLLVATGRVPNGDRLNLPAAGVPTHDDGRIVVDALPAHPGRRDLRDGRRELGTPAQARGQPRGPGGGAQPAAPGLAAAQRPPVRAVGGVHRPADRRGRPNRGAVPGRRSRRGRLGAELRRRGLRLGDGGHHRILQGAGRARVRSARSARTSSAPRPRR